MKHSFWDENPKSQSVYQTGQTQPCRANLGLPLRGSQPQSGVAVSGLGEQEPTETSVWSGRGGLFFGRTGFCLCRPLIR